MGELNKIHGEWVDFGALIDAVTRPAEPPRKRPSASRSRWGTDLGTERKKRAGPGRWISWISWIQIISDSTDFQLQMIIHPMTKRNSADFWISGIGIKTAW
jgi:hypothetical protein